MNHRYLAACAGLAFLCSNPSHAAVQVLGFTFAPLKCSGYQYLPGPFTTFDCGLTSLSGTFTFDDVNGDGHIVLAELANLTVGNISAPGLPGPGGAPTRVTAFDYAPATGLSFSAESYRYQVTTGVSYSYDAPFGGRVEAWLPTTTTSIFAVPEPGRPWLLLAGGCLVAWRARKSARTPRNLSAL